MPGFDQVIAEIESLERTLSGGGRVIADDIDAVAAKLEPFLKRAEGFYGDEMKAKVNMAKARVDALRDGRVLDQGKASGKSGVPFPKPAEVIHVKGNVALKNLLDNTVNTLIVIDWFAPWCGPCVGIAPFYKELAPKYPAVKFVSIDTEDPLNKLEQIGMLYQIRAFPTFTFHINGSEVERFSGANPQKLEEKVTQHMRKAEDYQIAAAIDASMSVSGAKSQAPPPAPVDDTAKLEIESAEKADPEPSTGTTLEIKIKRITGECITVKVDSDASIQHLRRKTAKSLDASLAATRLIFKGKILKDGSTLASYGINTEGLTVHVAISKGGGKKAAPSAQPTPVAAPRAGSAPSNIPPPATPQVAELRKKLEALEARNPRQAAKDAIQVMQLYVRNIVSHPGEVKYMSIRTGNAKFASKVGSCDGGMDCMKAIGFEVQNRDGEIYLVLNSSVSQETMKLYKEELAGMGDRLGALGTTRDPPAQTRTANPAPGLSGTNPFAAMFQGGSNLGDLMQGAPNMGNMGGFPMDMASVQQMQQEMANNPMHQQMMQRLMSNPELMNSLMSSMASGQDPLMAMMSNPQFSQLIAESMGSGFGSGMPAPAWGNSPAANPFSVPPSTTTPSNPNSTQNQNQNTQDDDDLDDLDDIYAD
uniref:Thioredoxin domain-containing protein n=1 Tax=Mucochytrium quahogii TaxID=96639 RepID=A0A7S2WTM3_9STRA|mmetsp:Transcript_6840/g.10831  ORF Transcript_6840/g.10831 Transcript_6840/m.10831 type:complete len:646 (-) Transcript_6840:2226-4163(-)